MGHLVPAAQQLIDQVSGKGKAEVLDEVDGLGFNRSIRLTPAIVNEYGDALEAIADERIAEIVKSPKGWRIEFVADTRADYPDPFPLDEAKAVLAED